LPDFQATSSATASIRSADIRQTAGFVAFGNVASGKQRTGQTEYSFEEFLESVEAMSQSGGEMGLAPTEETGVV